MKNIIFIPQYAFEMFAPKISWRACIVLDYLFGWQLFSSKKVKKAIFDNEEYLLLNYTTLMRDLPILRTKNKHLVGKIIDELAKYKLLKKKRTEDNTVYVRLTDLAVSIYNLPLQTIETPKYVELCKSPTQPTTTNDIITENTPDANKVEKPSEELPFNSEAYIESLKQSPQRHIQVIGLYWEYKHFHFENKEQAEKALRRDTKAATNLAPFSNERIIATMDYLNSYANYKWGLETIFKYINEDLDDLIAKEESRIKQQHY